MGKRRDTSIIGQPEDSHKADQHIDHILDLLSDGVYISDRKGRTLRINSAYERLTGLKKENLVGRNVQELTGKGLFDTIINPKIVQTGKPATSVQTDQRGNKLLLNGYPIFGEDGSVALVVTFVRDVTLMVHLKEQLAYQRRLIEKYRTNVEYINEESVQRHPLIAQSPAVAQLISFIESVAGTDATVLLQGETGVGKDVFARRIHQLSPRNGKPFLKVDCPTIPENLLESELFGYAPGAFSGARAKGKLGFFEMADKGTLFLDEVGELPVAMQAKLLRVLQDREIVRVGSTQTRKVDVRVISATNRDLEEEVRNGRFRSDLFYRLRVAVHTIPPLRERKEDILPLAQLFLSRYASRYNKTIRFESGLEEMFLGYRWPGNIRELQNLIQSLVIVNDGECIRISDLPSNMVGHLSGTCRDSASPAVERNDPGIKGIDIPASELCPDLATGNRSLKEIMSALEQKVLLHALEVYGSHAKVAERFKISRTTLFRKLQKNRV